MASLYVVMVVPYMVQDGSMSAVATRKSMLLTRVTARLDPGLAPSGNFTFTATQLYSATLVSCLTKRAVGTCTSSYKEDAYATAKCPAGDPCLLGVREPLQG